MKTKLFLLMVIGAMTIGRAPMMAQTTGNELRFISQQNGSTIGLELLASHQTIEYSTDGSTWNNMTTETTILLNNGDSVYLRGILSDGNAGNDYTKFTIQGAIKAVGNINYIWNYQDTNSALKYYCGYNMFRDCSGLVDVSDLILPSMTLSGNCYGSMFRSTSITVAPNLPATTLSQYCYQAMFQGCTALTAVPELPATTLTQSCYANMFQECTSLASVPNLPATELASHCYWRMFRGCTSVNSAPSILPATTLAPYCYNQMFMQTAITSAPELPATTLDEYSYYQMFYGCNKLNRIKCLATDISATSCTQGWVNGVASSGTFIKNNEMTSWTTGNDGIPSSWTIQNEDGAISGIVKIGDLYYNLDGTNKTAEVTSQNSKSPYWSTTITTANIPSSVTYNTTTYSVTSIGDNAFYNCTGLTAVTISNSVTSIGNNAFYGCTGLTFVDIPNSVTSIGNNAFYGCTGLTSIEIPNSVTNIANSAFEGCTGLTSINVDGENSNYCSLDGVLFNKSKTILIKYPKGRQGHYVIPNTVISIGDKAFYWCTGLTSIEIPEGVTSIEHAAFYRCDGLTSVTIPNSMTSIGESAFGNNDSYVNNLRHVTLGTSIRSEEKNYLMNGGFLLVFIYDDITIYNTIPPQAAIGYGNCFVAGVKISTVYVPGSAVRTYKDHDVWGQFNIQPIPGTEISGREIDVHYIDENETEISHEYIIFAFPDAPEIPGFSFVGWQPVSAIIEDKLELQAVYEYTGIYTSVAPDVVTNPIDPSQKLIREGNVYILRGDKTYTMQGQEVREWK